MVSTELLIGHSWYLVPFGNLKWSENYIQVFCGLITKGKYYGFQKACRSRYNLGAHTQTRFYINFKLYSRDSNRITTLWAVLIYIVDHNKKDTNIQLAITLCVQCDGFVILNSYSIFRFRAITREWTCYDWTHQPTNIIWKKWAVIKWSYVFAFQSWWKIDEMMLNKKTLTNRVGSILLDRRCKNENTLKRVIFL